MVAAVVLRDAAVVMCRGRGGAVDPGSERQGAGPERNGGDYPYASPHSLEHRFLLSIVDDPLYVWKVEIARSIAARSPRQ